MKICAMGDPFPPKYVQDNIENLIVSSNISSPELDASLEYV